MEPFLRKRDENEVLVLKGDSTTSSMGVNVDHEKSLSNFLYDGIDICIMMAHNIKIYIYIFLCEILMS